MPFCSHALTSESLMRREAFTMSGWSTPTPPQKSFMPPPVPVDSILGVLNPPMFPKCSATVVAKGYTVDEPTMVM